MIDGYFFPEARRQRLLAVAAAWHGTRFMPNAAVRGVGESCQKLVGTIYVECGALPPAFTIPEGPMDWGNAHTDSLIADFMAAQVAAGRFADVTADNRPLPGDAVGFRLGGCVHHLGLVVERGGKFIHCLRNIGTVYGQLDDASWLKRLEKIWRPLEVAA